MCVCMCVCMYVVFVRIFTQACMYLQVCSYLGIYVTMDVCFHWFYVMIPSSCVSADDLGTGTGDQSEEMPAIADMDTSSATVAGAWSDVASDNGPSNVASSLSVASSVASHVVPFSKASSIEEALPTALSISEDTAGTSSLVLGVFRANPEDPEAGYSQRDVVVIAVCVSLLSLGVVIVSVAMTFLIRYVASVSAWRRVGGVFNNDS